VFAVAVLGVGYLGVRFGRAIRERTSPPVVEAPPFPFAPGDAFPDVALADSSGTVVRSVDVAAGRVVLFLDPNCDGCTDMSVRWERALADGLVDAGRVLGVSRETSEIIGRYRAAHALSFPIYRDVEDAFIRQHGVVSYPLEVVVGASGTIRSLSDDSKTPIDEESIRLLLAQ
jgi:peroxiredoxin